MANPFEKIIKNSEKTKKQWDSEKKDSTVDAKQCNTCGAPRPKKTNLTTCDYCGTRFMSIDEKITPDL